MTITLHVIEHREENLLSDKYGENEFFSNARGKKMPLNGPFRLGFTMKPLKLKKG